MTTTLVSDIKILQEKVAVGIAVLAVFGTFSSFPLKNETCCVEKEVVLKGTEVLNGRTS